MSQDTTKDQNYALKLYDLAETLKEVMEEIEPFVDIEDSNDGPKANWAMSLNNKIYRALIRTGMVDK